MQADLAREQWDLYKERLPLEDERYDKAWQLQADRLALDDARYDQQWNVYSDQLGRANELSDRTLAMHEADRDRAIAALQPVLDFKERLPTEAEYETAAARAGADVDLAYDAAGRQLTRDLQRHGVNPMSGRYAGARRELALGRAAGRAGAMTGSRLNTRRRIAADEDRRFGRLSTGASLAGAHRTPISGVALPGAPGRGGIPGSPTGVSIASLPGQAASGLSSAAGGYAALGADAARSRASGLAGLGRAVGTGLGWYLGGPVGGAVGGSIFG